MKALVALCFWPIVSALVLLNGCKRGQEPNPMLVPTPSLATLYATALNDSLKNRGIGYGFVIYENATMVASGSGGFKSRVVDREGQQPYTIDTKMHIASMSKTIVAMAFARIISVAYHDGWWYRDDNKPYQGLRTIWMKLPDNLTVVLFTNALDSKTNLFPGTDGADIVAFAFRAYGKAKQLKGGRLGPVTTHIEHPEPH